MASRGVNKVILVGNVGVDPEARYLPSGGAVVNLTVATSDSWKDKNTGQMQERTEWHRVVFFNRLAEIVAEYLRKGSKVYIEGRLQTRSWEQDGVKRYATEIVANEMQMLDSRGGQSGGQQGGQQSGYGNDPFGQNSQAQGQPAQPAVSQSSQGGGIGDDDDIPF